MTCPRVVLDTNCLISALVFSKGQASWLRHSWQATQFIPLVSQATAKELLRVLGYPKFRLSTGEQQCLLAEFLPYAETVIVKTQTKDTPLLRDPGDTKFLDLAIYAHADALVTGDADLHAVKSHLAIPILTLTEFRETIDTGRNA
jgi:putative PIN family toxin of toxin-antitoxin system